MEQKNNSYQDRQISTNRSHAVVKHNRLIQKSRHNLSLQEQKIILYLVSKIKPDDTELIEYQFKILEFCRICGIEKSGRSYKELKNAIHTLTDKSFWMFINEYEETVVRWIEQPTINHKDGTIKIKINEHMRPFLLHLKDHFTKYELFYTLAMQNKYSLRMYELLKSYEYLRKKKFDFHELSKLLFAENYTKFYDFKRRVLEPAIKEINDYGDITVIHEYIKKERGFYDIEFIIKSKPINQKKEAIINVEKKIHKGQMCMFTPDINDIEENP